jgi:hypothetical protein
MIQTAVTKIYHYAATCDAPACSVVEAWETSETDDRVGPHGIVMETRMATLWFHSIECLHEYVDDVYVPTEMLNR